MRVQFQPSGGRGEYELSDTYGNLTPADLLGLELHVSWGPFGLRRSGLGVVQDETQGKYRLRTNHGSAHFQIQLAVGLLLPHPIREEGRLLGGQILILAGNYLVKRVDLTNVVQVDDHAEIAFGGIEVDNGTFSDTLDFGGRLARVVALHAKRDQLPDDLRNLIIEHRQLLETDRAITRADERIVRRIMREVEDVAPDYGAPYMPGTDPLPVLENMVADRVEPTDPFDSISIESIPEDDLELRRRVADRVQRLVAIRGPKSVRFRRDVTKAYRFRCIVCGMRFPKSSHCIVPGVDAAHVLAWSQVDLDHIRNGLCLCKTHHWAFDQQLIAINYGEETGEFRVEVTKRAEQAFDGDQVTLKALQSLERVIPRDWLPRSRDHWPSPQLLKKRLDDLPLHA